MIHVTNKQIENLISAIPDDYTNPHPVILLENAVRNQEGLLSESGALVVNTGIYTGRSPKDKFIVDYGQENIFWGEINQPLEPEIYKELLVRMLDYLENRVAYHVEMCAGAEAKSSIPLRIITEKAWAALFSHNLFIRQNSIESSASHPTNPFTILHCPDFTAPEGTKGLHSKTFVILNFNERTILIGGTAYAGEIKKSVFTVMNYFLPAKHILSMHCSANLGINNDVALFFGLSGTGKTTLSSDPSRQLIGDDEHGWSEAGIFNLEGGCYAKTINLNQEFEPIIWNASQQLFSVLENVILNDKTRKPDFNDTTLTENTRAAYPLDFVDHHVESGIAGHPKNIFFLSADASGILPPISKLDNAQAMYYFLSGYTSKLAGTERDLGKRPQATFSVCFGAPFLPLHPKVYCDLLGEKIRQHKVNVWLLNTGWSGGPYGIGKRIHLPYTRAMINAAISGALEHIPYHTDGFLDLRVPSRCPGVPQDILLPINNWQNKSEYQRHANHLIYQFEQNFDLYRDIMDIEVREAGPQLGK
ncbi:MAG: phosphoenolpyruvate carboxykinase (ATP) [Anaerolineae bacterium]|nr:phosphoenolpyruvate carboxykinase (ATP) [Anaerolineae bacterium]